MSPQEPSFNRGIWSQIESIVRLWAKQNQSIYIVTGPVLKTGLPTIGINKVTVPKYYYKVILDYTEPSLKGIAFLIENKGSKLPPQQFAVSIDSVEEITGINFFPLLPKDKELKLESKFDYSLW